MSALVVFYSFALNCISKLHHNNFFVASVQNSKCSILSISGTIDFTTSGLVTRLRLVHKSGYVGCKNDGITGFWGGCESQPPLNVWITADKDFPDKTKPEDITEDIKFPRGSVQASATNRGFYTMGSFDDASNQIEFNVEDDDFVSIQADKCRIWYGEDLFNRKQGGNQGTHCVEVFASYYNDYNDDEPEDTEDY